MKNSCSLFLFLFFLLPSAFAQNDLIINTEGIPPITVYDATAYKGFNQVWDVIQDDLGLIYLAETYNIIEFDGNNWRKIPMARGVIPRCFAKNNNGRIYLSGVGVIGYLEPNKMGQMGFFSLSGLLPKGKEIGRQEFVKTLNGKVYFAGANSILVYDEKSHNINYFDTRLKSYPNFVLDEKMYFKVSGKGLMVYEDDTIKQAPSSLHFEKLGVSDFISYYKDSAIAISMNHDLHYYSIDTAYKKSTKPSEFLSDKKPYKLLKISDNYNAICYLTGGLVITDKQWNPILHLDSKSGISNEIYKAYLDTDNNLWLASNDGVAVIEFASAHSRFDIESGISGQVTDIKEKDDNIYLTTTTGIYYKQTETNLTDGRMEIVPFQKVKDSDIYNDYMLSGNGSLLVRAYLSIGQIVNNTYQRLYTESETSSQLTFLRDSAYAITIGKGGPSMQLFELKNGEWSHARALNNNLLPERITDIFYDKKRDIIWGSTPAELFSFSISTYSKIENFKLYNEKDGLPPNSNKWLVSKNDELIFSTNDGVYDFDLKTERFTKSDVFKGHFEGKELAKLVVRNENTSYYTTQTLERGIITKANSGEYNVTPWKATKVMPHNSIPLHYVKSKGLYFGGLNEVNFIPEGKEENYGFGFRPLIRQLDVISGKDSTIFYGIFSNPDSSFSYAQKKPIEIVYEQNAIRLSYAIPYYRHPEKIQYQYHLEGFEEDWSEWTNKTQKEYTNLPAGNYVFKVKAMNGFLTVSEVGQIKIKILAPWYQTWWAYLFYLVLFIGFIRFILILNSKRLKAENEKLEETIKDRVKEIQEQKSVIAQSLVEKESLLKEIHHRVKNNLQIIANLLYLQSGKFEDENIKNVLEEGQGRVRSMALIHQKLYENEDLKSIPFGEYILELVNEIKSSFGEQAANVTVKVDAEEAFFDVDSAVPLGLIINELSTNAFKYAFEGKEEGKFNIFLTRSGDEYELHISDNGKGIPDEIDIRKTRSLGLRLVRVLSEQLEGEYEFESHNGMSFKLKFVA